MSKNIGVILSGCGVYDGGEVHESVITLLALARAGVNTICMAPNVPQLHVVDHVTQVATTEERNVLTESARIARGEIRDLADVKADELDALIIPGGFGAAKNLSDFAVSGPDGSVNPDVKRIINDMMTAKKPVGAICIAPATLVMAANAKVKVTIGTDEGTAQAIEKMGGVHVNCPVDEIVIDEENKVVSTPAYMLGPGIKDVASGIEKLVAKIVEMA